MISMIVYIIMCDDEIEAVFDSKDKVISYIEPTFDRFKDDKEWYEEAVKILRDKTADITDMFRIKVKEVE